jgi:hypothetical protein
MGDDPATSVTDPWGRFHEMDNLSAVGPALLPTLGSPNPMLSGVALARRMADRFNANAAPPATEGFVSLFDGSERSFRNWRSVGPCAFALLDGTIVAEPGGDLGLLYYAAKPFEHFRLKVQVRLNDRQDNSGVFVRFRDPERPVPDRNNPATLHPYDNPAYVPVDTGFEIQLDELARPDAAPRHRTGAIYDVPIGRNPGEQDYHAPAPMAAGVWHDLEITVVNETYTVRIDGEPVTSFTNKDSYRGRRPSEVPQSGFIGLQAHTGRIAFRSIELQTLKPDGTPLETAARSAAEAVR